MSGTGSESVDTERIIKGYMEPRTWHPEVAYNKVEYKAMRKMRKLNEMPALSDPVLRRYKRHFCQEFTEHMDPSNPPTDMDRRQILERLKYWPDIPNAVTSVSAWLSYIYCSRLAWTKPGLD